MQWHCIQYFKRNYTNCSQVLGSNCKSSYIIQGVEKSWRKLLLKQNNKSASIRSRMKSLFSEKKCNEKKSLLKIAFWLHFFQRNIYMQPSQLVKKNTRLRQRKDPSSWINLMCKSLAKNSTSLYLFQYCVCTSVSLVWWRKQPCTSKENSLLPLYKSLAKNSFSLWLFLVPICCMTRQTFWLTKVQHTGTPIFTDLN